MPTAPHPVNPVRPRPIPDPGRPKPAGKPPATPKKAALRMAVAVTAVGVLLLTVHYFVPFLLLAALPTKQWRAAA